MIRLEMMPMLTDISLCKIEPICSIQPPTNASLYSPNASTPFANVESDVPARMHTLSRVRPSSIISASPRYSPGAE